MNFTSRIEQLNKGFWSPPLAFDSMVAALDPKIDTATPLSRYGGSTDRALIRALASAGERSFLQQQRPRCRRHPLWRMRENNRVENSHMVIRRRERIQQKFKSQGSAQGFLASHAAVYKTLNLQPHLISRPTLRILQAQADQVWNAATVAA